MPRFNRLAVITGIVAVAFAVLGSAIAVMDSAKAHHMKDHDENGLTISYLGI